ncbi:MAG: glycoside hydrolase family 88 protein [Rhizomicrobium sp.]
MSAAEITPPKIHAAILALAEKVADHQIAQIAAGQYPLNSRPDTKDPRNWLQGAMMVGMTYLADRSPRPLYRDYIMARGEMNKWALGDRAYHADDQTVGASYLWAYSHGAGQAALAPMRVKYDAILANPPSGDLIFGDGHDCSQRWCWCDALFMAPPVWAGLSRATQDPRYLAYAKQEFWAVTAKLYDPQTHLFYRDSRFVSRLGPDGEKIFWSRGDGWVFAGLPRLIDQLPANDPDRARFIALFKDMAKTVKHIQLPTGYWAPSLLSDPAKALPESSGTAFYVYGMGWGVRHGILSQKEYGATMQRGWAALVRALHPDGTLGYVQAAGDQPDAVAYEDTQVYGTGAFLMAAAMMMDLSPH